MSLLQLHNVSKGYAGQGVLSGASLSVDEGEFVCVVGYSGTGKTTLMNLAAGLEKPDSGEVLLDGKPVAGPGPDRGIVFQNYSLLPWLTVEENIALAVDQLFPGWTTRERADQVRRHIDMVKLSHAAHRRPHELSGGMRQRVSVARALAMDSRMLLLDEPLSALDALTRASLQDDISDIWQSTRKTVVWITNDPDEAVLLADRAVPLLPGPTATLGEPLAIGLERPRGRAGVNHDPEFKRLRHTLVNTLLDAKNRTRSMASRRLTLPDILPEDLMRTNSLALLQRRGPRRRSDNRRVEVEILP